MSITLRQLEIFIAVARNGSVTRAAEEICISQSAVSMALSELEKQLNEKLFDRQDNKLYVNASGRTLLPMAQDVRARVLEIEDRFKSTMEGVSGDLRVGASSTIGNYLIPQIIGAFVSEYPDIRLALEVGNTEETVHQLLDFQIDAGFIEGSCRHRDIEAIAWRPDTLKVVASPHYPLATQAQPTPADLAHERWILREPGSGTREVFETAAAGVLDGMNIFLELGQTEAIKRAVEAGLGIGCLSALAVARELKSGELVEIPTPYLDLRRQFYLLLHKQKYQSRVLQAFLGFCQRDTA